MPGGTALTVLVAANDVVQNAAKVQGSYGSVEQLTAALKEKGDAIQLFASITLIIVLFEGGSRLKLGALARVAPRCGNAGQPTSFAGL